ncbi:MAG: NUDIX domain-containing protein [Thermoflexus sp.]
MGFKNNKEDPVVEEVPLESRRIYEGRILNLRVDTVRLPSGGTAIREVVEHRGAVAIVPILDDGQVALVRQFRYAVGEVSLEIPAGTLEPGEDPLICARRELEEETGYQAARWERLGTIWPTPGYSTEEIVLFIARDLTPGPAQPEFDETLSVVTMSWSEIWTAIEEGRLRDAKSIVALTWAARRLGGK